ncbi:riboflavin kinase [Candidatus Peregrinibacteria bacterium]|nr:riboflavin kinase [Candidatus Peregrinibacteria bacterium]
MLLSLQGKVLKGRGLGKQFGFPTLNLAYDGSMTGVFAGRIKIAGEFYPAAINLGKRQTIDDEKLCEIHVLGWDGDADFCEVELFVKIREIKKFPNITALREQIARDVEFVRNWYNATKYA